MDDAVKVIETPNIEQSERHAIDEIGRLQDRLRHHTIEPRRWIGSIRRAAQAAAIQGSNSIEGYVVSIEDAIALAGGADRVNDTDSHAVEAVKAYQRAMTYVLQAARDPDFDYSTGVLKALHFMTTEFDLDAKPGLIRTAPSFVVQAGTGDVQYTGPEHELAGHLVGALCEQLNSTSSGEPMVDAAMAHLNLVKIHPFRDGNGRMSRILQALVLTRSGTLVPEFASIEEYLGANTQSYYQTLADVGGPTWSPNQDARPWIRYCLNAHYHQAALLLRRIGEAEGLWDQLEKLAAESHVPERSVGPLYDAAMGRRVRNSSYVESVKTSTGDRISAQSATNDLRALVDAELFTLEGAKRGAHYLATERLILLRNTGSLSSVGPAIDLFA
jgi:Fic family protein